MKSYKNLYARVCEWDNLDEAYRRARLGKRSRPPAAEFEYNLEANLIDLRRELSSSGRAGARRLTFTPTPIAPFCPV
jgi:hypothetical protein